MGIREAGFERLDELRVSEIGRLRRLGLVSQSEYEAGVRYGNIMLLYLASIDAPDPYGGDVNSLEDEVCFGRKMAVAAAKTVLREFGPECMRVVDRVTVYDGPTQDSAELELLRAGLRALAGLPMRGDSFDAPADRESVWDHTVTVMTKVQSEDKKRFRERGRYARSQPPQ
jgi:hypothetical protein